MYSSLYEPHTVQTSLMPQKDKHFDEKYTLQNLTDLVEVIILHKQQFETNIMSFNGKLGIHVSHQDFEQPPES